MKKGVLAVVATLAGGVAGSAVSMKLSGKVTEERNKKVDKFKGYYNMLNQWLVLKQEGKSLEKYFKDNGYQTVAIYGMGEMGNRLYDELKNTDIEVKYAVDQNAANTYSELEVLDKEDVYAPVDVMVVTATFAYEEIVEEISKKADFPIISLEDVVYEI